MRNRRFYRAAYILYGVLGLALATSKVGASDLNHVIWDKADANHGFEDPCKNKDRCVIVFIAPWCGYCRASEPFISALRSDAAASSTFGLKIVIGSDNASALQTKARELGDNTFLDTNGLIMSAAGVRGYPSWISTDTEGTILARLGGAQTDTSDPARTQFLTRLAVKP